MLKETQDICIEDYNYDLPDERIAKFPLEKRDHSKLLIYKNGQLSERHFFDLPDLLHENSLLVFNNTKVIQARLLFEKETGAQIEIFCLEPHEPADYAQAFQQKKQCEWKCMVGNSKKWKEGKIYSLQHHTLAAQRITSDGETSIVRFEWDDESLTFADVLDAIGELPIPPYLHRQTCESDKRTYQTVYSKIKGSVAAPTAGLHFTQEVLERIKQKGIQTEELTLHVGAGTFRPVKSDKIKNHTMHSEVISVKKETIAQLINKEGHIVAVGTTSVRTLESLFYVGVLLQKNPNADASQLQVQQWLPYDNIPTISTKEALLNILNYLEINKLDRLQTSTQIIIAPGYEFKVVNQIITNFHQPKSTLLLLISAYLKGDWKGIYQYALDHEFRFLSYGDSSLLIKE